MKSVLTALFVFIFAGQVQAQNTSPSASKATFIGTLIEFKNGVLKIEMDTCGGQVQPVVSFKPLEEITDPSMMYGSYLVTIRKSVDLPPTAICPMVAPKPIEIDLKQQIAEWAASANGSPAAKTILQNKGEFEIVVSPLLVRIRHRFLMK